jgi:hypothetical protein
MILLGRYLGVCTIICANSRIIEKHPWVNGDPAIESPITVKAARLESSREISLGTYVALLLLGTIISSLLGITVVSAGVESEVSEPGSKRGRPSNLGVAPEQ